MTPYDPTQQPPQPVTRLPLAAGAPQAQPDPMALPRARVPIPSQATASPKAQEPLQTRIPIPEAGIPGLSQNETTQQDMIRRGSPIHQIHNPVLRTAAGIGDAILGTFAPRAEALIPGTEGHYARELRRAGEAVKGEREGAKEASENAYRGAQSEHLGAETNTLIPAQAANYNAEAQSRTNPKITNEFEKWLADNPQANLDDWEKFKADHEHAVKVATPFEKWMKDNPDAKVEDWLKVEAANRPQQGREGELPLGDFANQMNLANEERYHVLHPGQQLPTQYRLTPQSTQKQADEIKSLIGGTEAAEGVKTAREQAAATAAANREHKDEGVLRQAGMKAYTPALESAERFNVMTKNYEDAVRNHDQQAMLSLLANHLGMTMGLQKGARMTRDIIREAQQSRPWLQGMQAKFDKDGYLSGVTLTPQQMRQMVDLGRERFSQDVSKGRAEAQYMGVPDEGPQRTPSKATINHYTALANGNAAEAKRLAAEDGWTVK